MVSDKNGCKKNKLYDCNGTPTRYHLVHKRTLNHLAKLASVTKRLNIRLRTKWFDSHCSHFTYRTCYKQGTP